jgi:hypothetical protein
VPEEISASSKLPPDRLDPTLLSSDPLDEVILGLFGQGFSQEDVRNPPECCIKKGWIE